MAIPPARRLWQAVESVHAVTYFHPDALAAMADAGTRGFWMAYFAGRMAPLGAIGPSTATAVCCNFAPVRAARALPDAWAYVSPSEALAARSRGAVAALEACGLDDGWAFDAAEALEPLVAGLDPSGRALGAANLDVDLPDGSLARLWQLCTTIREHRGDGHVALLVAADLDGCEANVLATAVTGMDPAVLRDTRAWSGDEWDAAIGRLAGRGLVTADGGPTEAGRELRTDLERRTDALAARSYGDVDVAALVALVLPLSRAVGASGVLPFPNPMGLPHE
jgi:hypothetical protein